MLKTGRSSSSATRQRVLRGDRGACRYDPRPKQVRLIDTCFSTDHNDFGAPPDSKLFFGHGSGVAWIKTRIFDETNHDIRCSTAAQYRPGSARSV